MANQNHLDKLKEGIQKGIEYWNLWRREDSTRPDLSGVDLNGKDLSSANLRGANLSGANLRGANLSVADLSDADLNDADLSRADLSIADLSRADLRRAILSGANLRGANLSVADLSDKDLSGVDLSDADLSRADLSYADLSDADLSGAILSGAILSDADLSRADLSDADLSGTDLSDADLSDADLSGANLSRADLSYADLSDADLSGADLSGANLSGAILSDANLKDAIIIDESTKIEPKWYLVWEIVNQEANGKDLSGADLSDANLSGANLSLADLSGANLSGANLSGAKLSDANLSRADLSRADLSRANLSDANLSDADLSDADLSGAKLSHADLGGSKLSHADLSDKDLSGADLSCADLLGADLSRANLSYANLSRANLSYANLSGTNLSDKDLSGADLSGANLSHANLSGANLSHADLSDADLSDKDLSGANLNGANLSDADLSGANLNGANLSDADLSGANLNGADFNDVKELTTANLSNTNFSGALGIEVKKILKERENLLRNTLAPIIRKDYKDNAAGLNKLTEGIKQLISIEKSKLMVGDKLQELIEAAFVVSFKKEESRYPKFKIYVPIEQNCLNNSYGCKQNSNFMISFNDEKNLDKNNVDKNIDIALNLATFARIGLGIPHHSALLIKEKPKESESEQPILVIERIIKIENKDELFGELFNRSTTLFGLLLSIEDPGRLHIVYHLKNGITVPLTLVEGKVRISYDPVLNPLANTLFFQIAKNLSAQRKFIIDSEKSDFNKKLYELMKIIQRVWHRILKLAVNLGHGSQFVIIPNDFSPELRLSNYFNIGQFTTQKPNLGKCIIDFFEEYYTYRDSDDNLKKRLLINYHQLVNSIDFIAYLSTIDGSIILDDNLSLIGFQGEVKTKEDFKEKYYEVKIEPNFGDPLFQQSDDLEILYKKDKSKVKEFFSKSLINDEKLQKWNLEEFGTRHRSAARLCTASELDPFVFVVSQTGDIREFTNLKDKNNENYVGIFGPLRPL
ncbi:pentapeptide repeat-containing protein [Scytonema sp. PRP1]|uniref:pentapeptide repeat-containing protein n=1 Tax=Scytonema sp. PRP1 TaxID=3120513 RepID=UPI00300D1ED1